MYSRGFPCLTRSYIPYKFTEFHEFMSNIAYALAKHANSFQKYESYFIHTLTDQLMC